MFVMVAILRWSWARRLVVVLGVVVIAASSPGLGPVGSVAAMEEVGGEIDIEDVWIESNGGFSDIADAGVHRADVEILSELGILAGTECASGKFCPNEPIARWVMAVWLVRAVEDAEPAVVQSSRFADVEGDEWWSPYVERLADLDITRGCATQPARFCPTGVVTRAQMASFLVRAFQLVPGPSERFVDVDGDNSHAADINALVAAGITVGCATEPARYCPSRDTTRAQMATFLARALGLNTPPSEEGTFTTIDAGDGHTCGVRTDQTITCWGTNEYGQADPPEGEFAVIAAGGNHSCGLRVDQTITCWGADWADQSSPPEGKFASVAAGWLYSCGVRTDNTITCWGDDRYGQVPGGTFTDVTIGGGYSCGLRTDETITCWGDDQDGSTNPPNGTFTSVTAGSLNACGMRTDLTIKCWGWDPWGQYGAWARRFIAISKGGSHSCGIRPDQTVICWGGNDHGQANPPRGEFVAITAGGYHSCGLRTDQTVICWGRDYHDRVLPRQGGFTAVTAGRSHACGLRADQTVSCWGRQWGRTVPRKGGFTAVAAGWEHTCGIRTDQTITCWGEDNAGQVHPPEHEFTAMAAGWTQSCGLGTDQTITCWGVYWYGQKHPPKGEYAAVTTGSTHACGLRSDQTITCWGKNDDGQGDPPEGKFVAVAAGDLHSCGLLTDSTVACWGANWGGRTASPKGEFTAIGVGSAHSCGIRTDQTVSCWGTNQNGEANPPKGEFTAISAGKDYTCGLRTDGTVACWGRTLVEPTPVDVQHFTGPGQPDPDVCRPSGTGGVTAGFPLPGNAPPAVGKIRVAVLFVDFPDAQATHSTHQEAALGLPHTEEYLETVSYGKLDIEFVPLHRWLRAGKNHHFFLADDFLLDKEVVRLADPVVDFTGYDIVMIILPSSHFGDGGAGGTIRTKEGAVWNTTWIGTVPLDESREPTQWGSVGAHELVHNLGLPDLYPSDWTLHQHPNAPEDTTWIFTGFGLMGLKAYYPTAKDDSRLAYEVTSPSGHRYTSYSNGLSADEMLAWSRWQLGWLEPNQIRCLSKPEPEVTITLSPVAFPDNGVAMVAIPVSDTELVVIESRRKLGYDAGKQHQWADGSQATLPALAEEGLFVYTVDASIHHGSLPLKVVGDTGNGHVDNYPILTEGQSVTIHGYTITVASTTHRTDTVTITNGGSP